MKAGEGAMGHVALTREPYIIPDYHAWASRSDQYAQSDFHAVMVAPLLMGRQLVGAIAFMDRDVERKFGPEDLRLLDLFAPQAAVAIENARLFSAERRRAQEQQALLDTMKDLAGQLELSKVLQRVLERAVGLLSVTGGELATYDEAKGDLVIVASHNMGTDAVGARIALGDGAMGRVAQTRESIIIPRYQDWEGRSSQYTQTTVQAVMAAPLLIGSRLVGTIASVHSDPGRLLGSEDLRLLELFAPQAAIAIENARLFTQAKHQQQYFSELVANSPVAIVTLDRDHNVVSCNPAFLALYGFAESEVLGHHLDDLISTEADRAEAVRYTTQALESKPVRAIARRRRKDGSMVDVEVLGVPVLVDGELVGLMALYHDVTALLQARRDAESANAAKSDFLANMSHELRTPLNAIIGYSEMLEEDAVDRDAEEAITDLRRIRAAGHHLLALINDVLDLSKIEAGKMELHLEDFDLTAAIDAVASTVAPLIEKNGNVLALALEPEMGIIHADVTRVRQVLFNLLSNASKFTERGTVTLAGARRTEGHVDWIELTVRDTGIGMTPEQLGRLFNAFAQAEASTAKKYGGTGLGLVISRMFCEMMGGTITVTSEAGVGTTFTVRIPAVVADPGATPIPVVASEGTGASGTVLVIDDDPATRDLLSRMLARDGYRVLQAADGATGLTIARTYRPDVITLDVVMPGLDGWEVLSALKEDPEIAAIPVVMLTITDDRNLGFSLGASEYLTKPIERERLAAVLARYRRTPGASVLIVEDDGDTRTMLRRSLEKEGWAIVEAENGRVGLEALQSATPALILLDLMMPEMDGFQFLEALRADPAHAGIEVVVMTAKVLTNEDRRLLSGGVQRVLHKGEQNESAFLAAVRSHLVA